MIKTLEFERKLQSNIYQYTFNKSYPPVLLGSFKNSSYISDIDFSSFVRFNQTLIDILINKIKKLRDFKFLYLKSGFDERFKLPWSINYEASKPFGDSLETCNFDLNKTLEWFEELKEKNILPIEIYSEINSILQKEELVLGDIIDIQDIIFKYSSIKWFYPDIIKGSKTIGENTYMLLEELKKSYTSVINTIYIDGDTNISVDIALVDKNYKKPILSRMYKYYTKNWYEILKSYKKLISKDFEQEYRSVMKTFELDNSILGQTKLLESILKYNVFPPEKIFKVSHNVKQLLSSIGLNSLNLNDIIKELINILNNRAKPFVDYFLDKLQNPKILTYMKLRLLEISNIPTNKKLLVERFNKGIKCPFFEEYIDEYLNTMSSKLMIDKTLFKSCLKKISDKKHISIQDVINKYFNDIPISRLFLEIKNDNLYVRGDLIDKDYNFLKDIGEQRHDYYVLNIKYTKKLQIYLLSNM